MANAQEWQLTTFEDIAKFLHDNETSALAFAKWVGVSNSTFHNWKAGRSTPNHAKQVVIVAVMKNKGHFDPAPPVRVPRVVKKKAKAKKVVKPANTAALDALLGKRKESWEQVVVQDYLSKNALGENLEALTSTLAACKAGLA